MKPISIKTGLIASAAVLLIAAGPKADLNQDGQVTKAEFTEAAKAHFVAADTNGDNFLSEDERKAFRAARLSEMKDKRFEKLDSDGDGSISRAEMDAASDKMKARREKMKSKMKEKALERFDTNLDGELSEAERTVMKAEREARGGDRKADRNGKRGIRGMRGKRGDRPNPDANGDGFVSLDEHMTVSEQLFTRLDANADGVLTKGEGKRRRGGKRRR